MKFYSKQAYVTAACVIFTVISMRATASAQDQSFVAPVKQAVFNAGSVDPNSGFLLQLSGDTRYGAVETIKLSRHFAKVKDKLVYEKDPKGYTQLLAENPELASGHYSLINPISNDLAMATMNVTVTPEGEESYSIKPVGWQHDPSLDKVDENSQSISMAWKLFRGPDASQAKPVLQIIKTYKVTKNSYMVDVSLEVKNLGEKEIEVQIDQRGPSGLGLEDLRNDSRFAGWAKLTDGKAKVELKLKGKLQKDHSRQVIGYSSDAQPVLWVGSGNKYFGSVLYIKPRVEGRLQAADYRAQFYYKPVLESEDSWVPITGVVFPSIVLKGKETQTINMQLFAGPKDREMFTDENSPYFNPLYQQLNFIDMISFGSCSFCTIPWLTFGMMWLLDALSKFALGNYGIAIFLLVIIVRVVLHPLTKKGQVMMMGMQKFGPEMEKIKQKYAHDKQALNRETMAFYKKQGASPFLGCLPMFLQMPIWIALWTGLNASINLRHEGLLPFWINDLSAPDSVFSFGFTIPLLGISTLNLLPLLMIVPMIYQMKMNPQMATTKLSPEQEQSQKLMKYLFPVMMPIVLYNAPSGVSLYILTSTAAGVIEQIVIRKHIKERQEMEQSQTTFIDVGGKAPRSSRPKKEKGPNWYKKPF